MTTNFNLLHRNAIRRELADKADVKVKFSRVYHNAVVIGRLDKPGSVLLSQGGEDMEFIWLVHHFEEHDPKAVSDGKVDTLIAQEYRFTSWGDLIKFLKGSF